MSCNNKFQNELDLTLLDYEPETLIVGTFNPGPPIVNPAEWFYGRTASSCFWDILPRLYGEQSLIDATAADWKLFCRNKRIAITDLIGAIDDVDADNPEHIKALGGFADRAIEYNFDDFEFINIVQILQRRPTIRNVYLTRGITDAYWKHLWNPVMQYCNKNGIRERKLLPPSNGELYQHGAYNEQHPENRIALVEDYILMRWQQEWHF